jgi:hypothetical protein
VSVLFYARPDRTQAPRGPPVGSARACSQRRKRPRLDLMDVAGRARMVADSPCFEEVNCDPALRLQSAVYASRWLMFLGIILPLALMRWTVPLRLLAAAALGIALIDAVLVRRTRFLITAEILLHAMILITFSFVAPWIAFHGAAAYSERYGHLAILPAFLFGATAIYCCHRLVYPTVLDPAQTQESLTHIFKLRRKVAEPRRVESSAVLWWLLLIILANVSWQSIPNGAREEFLLLMAGLLASYFVYGKVLPAAWSLRNGHSFRPLQMVARNRKARIKPGRIRYVLVHSRRVEVNLGLAALALIVGIATIWGLHDLLAAKTGIPLNNLAAKAGIPLNHLPLTPLFIWLSSTMWSPLVLIPLSRALAAMARSMNSDAAATLDSGRFTLYLRSFEDDDFKVDHMSQGLRRLLFVALVRSRRLETMIVNTLWRYGPVIRVMPQSSSQAPSSFPPSLPVALNVTVAGDQWQEEVLERARKASSIVLVLGRTAGLRWEFRALADSELRRKLVLIIPPEDEDELVARWRALLGETLGHEPILRDAIIRAIAIKFSADGGGTLFTSAERSVGAYELALHLSQVSDLVI